MNSKSSSQNSLNVNNPLFGAGGGGTPTSNQARNVELSGWLHKWTNYMKGYRQRWFILTKDGFLYYFRNASDVGHSCRGVINLQGALIHAENACHIVVSGGGSSSTYHLKAANEIERQKWVTSLELTKHRVIKAAEEEADEEEKLDQQDIADGNGQLSDLQNALRQLQAKVDDIHACRDLIGKHGQSLQRILHDVEASSNGNNSQERPLPDRVKIVNERATLFRITTNAMLNVCNEFTEIAVQYNGRWHRLLAHEHEQRVQLQDQLQELALQHSRLERQAIKEKHSMRLQEQRHNATLTPVVAANVVSDSEDECTFHDAAEEIDDIAYQSATDIDRMSLGHGSNGNMMKMNGGNGGRRKQSAGGDVTPKAGGHISNSSDGHGRHRVRTGSETSRAEEQEGKRAATESLFRARIVTVPSVSLGDDESGKSTPPSPESERRGAAGAPSKALLARRRRRTEIPPKPAHGLNLWSVMRNCIGKELTKIPMPVNFNEPLSVLQRVTENMEYSEILHRAVKKSDSTEQLCFVAAFVVSSYSTTSANRATKPFNPLLGETYEADRTDDLGWRSLAEQVSHHPPTMAHFAEGSGWWMNQEFTMTSKFRGKYLSVLPVGVAHLEFTNNGNHYTWRKVTTTVHNIIVGKLWIDNHGEMTIENHKTGDKCSLKFHPYSYFSREPPRKISGVVQDKTGKVRWIVQGTWDKYIECMKVIGGNANNNTFETLPAKRIWECNAPYPGSEKFYNFTRLAVELNEMEEGVAPTDSRRRPDQRLMEDGRWDEANAEKVRLEDRQRSVRRMREEEAELAVQQGRPIEEYQSMWFKKERDPYCGDVVHNYTHRYFDAKRDQRWEGCPDIF